MTSEDALIALKNAHQKLMSLKWPDMSFFTIIPYELMATIKDCDSLNTEYIRRVNECLLNLKNEKSAEKQLRDSFHWAFGNLHWFNINKEASLKNMVDERTYRVYQISWDVVCRDLIAFLEHSITMGNAKKASKVGRPPNPPAPALYKQEHISWNGKSCKLRANSLLARVSEMMLAPSVRIGEKRSWTDVYAQVYEAEASSDDDWRKLDNRVRTLNENVGEEGIDPVLQFEGGSNGHIIRLL